ncbi:hypothetical protein E3J74_03480 [Candidatus Bathyarchaeota archaeon]|nr:MAG: hypothetical protein E3J74_03480 [Candidatus Bathyarchaeota archaeon]
MHAHFMYTVGKTLIQTNLSFSRYTMSKIDLEKIIARQKYFIPVNSTKLKDKIIKELNASWQVIAGYSRWFLSTEHGLSFHFTIAMEHLFLFELTYGMDLKTEKNKKLVEEKLAEYKRKGSKAFYTHLQSIRSDLPAEVYVSVVNREEKGCLCKTECHPMLCGQLRFIKGFKTEELDIQRAYLESKRFLEMIFESGLSATLISEEKKKPPQTITQFLISDQTSHKILKKIEPMLDGATVEVLVCGWVGTLLLPKLRVLKEKGINIRIMTHKSTELKGKPGRQDVDRAHVELMSLLGGENISMNPECHFRVLVVDNKALVGSMDFNAISLTGTHREFAIYTEDPEIVRSIRNYFNQVFTPLEQ